MPEVTKETTVIQDGQGSSTARVRMEEKLTGPQVVQRWIYFVGGIIEMLLTFRLVLKLMGASSASSFVRWIYAVTQPLIGPFEGIFHRTVAPGIETTAVLEPATLVALVVYTFIGWAIAQFVEVISREPPQVE